ncbi:LAMI_0F02366g1_1 [Lachancea mirantina]|uniref:LAMI_0F02366g1_1 n=1 Tax=Lachancea mirantina TaxID=1230905 RepID=A0A1G4JWJ9_9SACH|nr:LAMI_0F02366g1_1 [Lachancea mirantina]
MDLSDVIKHDLDLYALLDLHVSCKEDLLKYTSNEIRKNYRRKALIYHPDKNPNDEKAIHTFHLLGVAVGILTDAQRRTAYNSWFAAKHWTHVERNKEREGQIKVLKEREQESKEAANSWPLHDILQYEEYGINLRILKQLDKPYGDWQHLDLDDDKKKKHRFYESSTLRVLLSNRKLLQEKPALADFLATAFGAELFDLYYSSRNDFGRDSSIVAYVVMKTPESAYQIWEHWKSGVLAKSSKTLMASLIEDVSPRVPIETFSFPHRQELNDQIAAKIIELGPLPHT